MSFVGPVNRLDNGFVRPHDLTVQLEADGAAREATVERVVHLGFEVRVEMALDGTKVSSQVTREEAERLELRPGQQVYVQTSNPRSFG